MGRRMARFHSPNGHEDHAEPQRFDIQDLGGADRRSAERLHRLSAEMMADAEALPRALRELAYKLAAALATRDDGDDDIS